MLCILHVLTKIWLFARRFIHSIVSPMVNCSTGDLTDVNNYRAIAISNNMSKILETVRYNLLSATTKPIPISFDFRNNHSTAVYPVPDRVKPSFVIFEIRAL